MRQDRRRLAQTCTKFDRPLDPIFGRILAVFVHLTKQAGCIDFLRERHAHFVCLVSLPASKSERRARSCLLQLVKSVKSTRICVSTHRVLYLAFFAGVISVFSSHALFMIVLFGVQCYNGLRRVLPPKRNSNNLSLPASPSSGGLKL